MTVNDRSRTMKRLVYTAFILTGIIFGALMFQKYRSRHVVPPTAKPSEAGTQVVTLFFAAPDGNGFIPEAREIDACNDESGCIDEILTELASGPLGDLKPTVPDSTTVYSVHVEGNTAIIDFGPELSEGLPGGSSSEMTAVYSIVDTVSFNFPHIKKVQFLINGETRPVLKEHLDLTKPIEPKPELERKQH